MKDASQFPITFPYGGTDGTFYGPAAQGKATYIGPYHRGDDRYMPTGTPVLVNGVQLGVSGQTGAASGPHLHIGRFVSGKDTNPAGAGFTLTNAHVYDTGYDGTNGNYVRVMDGAGVLWVYLHMSRVDATKNQVLPEGGEDMVNYPTAEQVVSHFGAYQVTGKAPDGKPSAEQITYYTSNPFAVLYVDLLNYNHDRRRELEDQLNAATSGYAPYNGPQLYERK